MDKRLGMIEAAFEKVAAVERKKTADVVEHWRCMAERLPVEVEARLASFRDDLMKVNTSVLDVILEAGCVTGTIRFDRTRNDCYVIYKANGQPEETWESQAFENLGQQVTSKLNDRQGLLAEGSYELVFFVKKAEPKTTPEVRA